MKVVALTNTLFWILLFAFASRCTVQPVEQEIEQKTRLDYIKEKHELPSDFKCYVCWAIDNDYDVTGEDHIKDCNWEYLRRQAVDNKYAKIAFDQIHAYRSNGYGFDEAVWAAIEYYYILLKNEQLFESSKGK